MDFGALPPELNSGRMYLGPGPGALLTASAGWDALAVELHTAADACQSLIRALADGSWFGPSSASMLSAVTPYVSWMRATACRCEQAARQATAAAAAYEAAFAMTVPPPVVAANRVRLMALVATNLLGQNTPAIMAIEAEYGEMWARDAAAMYDYAANSATASAFSVFTPPPQTSRPTGLVVKQATARGASGQPITPGVQALRELANPGASGTSSPDAAAGSNGGASASVGHAASLGAVSVPPGWPDAVSSATPPPTLDANVMPGGWGAAPSAVGSGLPVGRTAGHAHDGAARRTRLRASVLSRSSVAG